jgi:hypothetical protein
VHFDIVHEFDIPLDALELAVLSPDLAEKLAGHLPNMATLTQTEHDLHDGILERVWSFDPSVKVPSFARDYVSQDMLRYEERSTYTLSTHVATWKVVPHVRPEWQKYFRASGTYGLEAIDGGRTRRVVHGDMRLEVPVLGAMVERMILAEVRRVFDAEAKTIRDLATLT